MASIDPVLNMIFISFFLKKEIAIINLDEVESISSGR